MLIAHIVFRFDYGGLENGLVNVINGTSSDSIRHTVIALSEFTDFADRLQGNVQVFALNKKPGKDFGAYWRLYKLLCELKPDVLHTRNIGTMDCAFIGFLARVPVRIHGEHGWDIFDPDGTNRKYRLMRRVLSRFIHQFVTVSADLRNWLIEVIGLPADRIQHICNGVDTERFYPRNGEHELTDIVIGSVTRFSPIKDPLNLAQAFCSIRKANLSARLLMVGDGELREAALRKLDECDAICAANLPGSRDDVADQLRNMDVFVLGSLREGISNTILEAMATGLPVIASDTGGNPELIAHNENGMLVPPGDSQALAEAILGYLNNTSRLREHGMESRQRAEDRFSISVMLNAYRQLYTGAMHFRGKH